MMDSDDSNSEYTKSANGATSKSKLSEKEPKPHRRNRKKDKRSKSRGKTEKKKKKDNNEAPSKNTCPNHNKIQRRKPHRVDLDKCMWNKKYKGYRFKSICNKLDVAFKPCHLFTAEMGGYANMEDSERK